MAAWLDDLSLVVAGLAWLGWLLLGNARAHLTPADRIGDRGTFLFALATLIASVALAAALAVAWPAAAVAGPGWLPRLAGALLAALGIVLREWAIRALGASFTQVVAVRDEQPLVTSGPYRFVRHPGYAGSVLTLTGLGLTLGNWGSFAVLAAGSFGAHLPRIAVEERTLEGQFGEAYRGFERTHKRLVPGIW